MKIKHIVWDWNGTLLNDNWLSLNAINILLEKYSLPKIEIDRYLEIFTFPVIDYYQKLGFDFDKLSFEIVGTEFITEYTNGMYDATMHAGAVDVLKYFNNKGISQSVLSAAKQQMLDNLMKFHNIEKYFVKVTGLTDHYANSKVDAGKEWIKKLDCSPSEVLFIGDTLHDFEVAKEIGTECVLIAQGHTSFDRLKSVGKEVFTNFLELKEWFIKNENI